MPVRRAQGSNQGWAGEEGDEGKGATAQAPARRPAPAAHRALLLYRIIAALRLTYIFLYILTSTAGQGSQGRG